MELVNGSSSSIFVGFVGRRGSIRTLSLYGVFFLGVEVLHRIYKEDEFITRNIRSSRLEGVFDIWNLVLRPQVLPGFIITDTVSIAGGAYWLFAYLPDRVCRQFRAGHVLDLWIAYYARLKSSGKPTTSSKGKKGVSSSCEVIPPLPKKATHGCKSFPTGLIDDSPSYVAKKHSSTRSAKAPNTEEPVQEDEVV
ncbi:hypothetical protein SESBI_20659 [Sesbania bispinosa]|nr:hypothetical protein SESBI_20659 [Sesbania bispinosa]